MLSQRGEGAQVAPRTPSVTQPRPTREDENKAIVHSGTTDPVCHVSRSFGGVKRHVRDIALAVAAVAVFVGLMLAAGALADHLSPLSACILGGTIVVGMLLLFAWREDERR